MSLNPLTVPACFAHSLKANNILYTLFYWQKIMNNILFVLLENVFEVLLMELKGIQS